MLSFPLVCGDHLDGVPRAAVKKRAVRPLAGAFLASNAEIRINFDAAKRRVIFVRDPEHAAFYRAIFDAGRRPGAAGAAVGRDGEDFGFLFARRFPIALRHRPVFLDDLYHDWLQVRSVPKSTVTL